MAEYLAAEILKHSLLTPLIWVEHYPEHAGFASGRAVTLRTLLYS